MINNFEPTENNELMDVLNNSDKEKIAKAIDGLNTLDFSCFK